MVTLETKKYNIISQIITLNNERVVSEVEDFVRNISLQLYYNELFKPIKKDLIIDEMIKTQQYRGVNRQYFDNLVQELDIQDPINELIANN